MRLAVTLAAALAACTPSVKTSDVSAVDDAGNPIARLAVPLEPIGGSMVLLISIENLGHAPASPLALALSGDVAADFTIEGGCVGVALAADTACQVQLFFKAAHAGKLTADLDITTDDTTQLELDTDVFKPQP